MPSCGNSVLGFGLFFTILIFPSAGLAGQTVDVNIAVTHPNNIYGNGDTPVTSSGNGSPTLGASGNTVNINAGGSVANQICGGYTVANDTDASNNTINVYSGNNGDITGGLSNDGQASNNRIFIDSGAGNISTITGGMGHTDASGNTITLSGGIFSNSLITGGQAFSGNIINNVVTINAFSGSLFLVTGSSAPFPPYDTFTGNTLNINGADTARGTIDRIARFEYINFGSGVTNPKISNLYIDNGQDVKLNVGSGENVNFGAIIQPDAVGDVGGITKTGAGTLTLNAVNTYTGMTTVRDGELVLGASGSLASNMLSLHSATTFNALNGLGSHSLNGGALNVHGSASYIGNLSAQNARLNFFVPTNMSSGSTMLAVTGTTDITGGTVNVGIEGASSPLMKGDTVTLIDSTGPLTGAPVNTTANGQGMQGVTLKYTFDILTANNRLLATVSGSGVNEQAKALSEGFLGGMGLLTQGADVAAGQGMDSAVAAARSSAAGGYGLAGFGALSGGSVRYNTGSHVDMHSLSLLTGLAWGTDIAPGRLTLGAFFEYGNGSYDTYNSFSNAASVDGNGNTHYLGGGILGRMDFINAGPGHFYTEASGRAGKVDNSYDSSDLRDATGREASYDSTSAYYGLHLGAGYIWNLTDKASLDLYGKYFWTRQEGDSVTLSTGDPIDFDDVYSSRLRFGSRFAYTVNEYVSPYVGAAWENEFDGKAHATTYGYDIKAPSLRGDTGIGELGLTFTPSPTLPLSCDLGVEDAKKGLTRNRKSLNLFWWSWRELNPRPLECHSSALPTELQPH